MSAGEAPLRTGALEVVDADGRVRARLGIGPDGALALDLADEANLLDGAGALRTRVGQRAADDGAREGGPASIELYGSRGDFKVAMGEYPDGAGRLNLWDASGEPIDGPGGPSPEPPSE